MMKLLKALERSRSGLKHRAGIDKSSVMGSHLRASSSIDNDGDDVDGVVVKLRLPDRSIRILRPYLTTYVAGGDFNC